MPGPLAFILTIVIGIAVLLAAVWLGLWLLRLVFHLALLAVVTILFLLVGGRTEA